MTCYASVIEKLEAVGTALLNAGNGHHAVVVRHCADTLTTQSDLIETLTRERDEARENFAFQTGVMDEILKGKEAAEAALADARDKALEEAAVVAEKESLPPNWDGHLIGACIRSLKVKP
jgi:hypothetical protein